MLVIGDDALEFLQQVERHVRLPLGDPRAQVAEVVVEAQYLDLMPRLTQAGHHVVLGLPLVDGLLGMTLQTVGGHQTFVGQHEGTKFLHRA